MSTLGFNYVFTDSIVDTDKRGSPLESSIGCTVEGVITAGFVGGNFRISLTENVWGQVALMGTGR